MELVIAIGSIPCAWALTYGLLSSPAAWQYGHGHGRLLCQQYLSSCRFLYHHPFCTWKLGWGFDRFIEEANEGQGLSVARKFQWYFKYILPCIVGFLVVYGIVTYFR